MGKCATAPQPLSPPRRGEGADRVAWRGSWRQAMADAAAAATAGNLLRRRARGEAPAPAVGPLPAHHADQAAAAGCAVRLALARHRAVPAPLGRRGLDQRHRAPCADHGASGVRSRDDHHEHAARRLHSARSRRPRPPAPSHRRRDPLRHPRRRRGHHRRRPPLRDEGGRPDPDPAHGMARPHQRQRSPHHLV